jgi:hypothetical protein
MKYARVLLEHCPKDTTQLFTDYFTGHYRPKTTEAIVAPVEAQQAGYAAGAVNAVQNLRDLLPLPYMNASAIASPSTQGNVVATVSDNEVVAAADQRPPAPQYTPPKPRTAFSSFVDHPDEFIVFLEACL